MSGAEYAHIRYEREGPLAIVTIARPEVRNAVAPETARELARAWRTFRDEEDALVGILTGDGAVFCAGADLRAYPEALAGVTGETLAAEESGGTGYLGYTRGTDIVKPTIAAIEGGAFAGGLEWACWCDLRVAAEDAEFGVVNRRWNIGLADGGTVRLWRIVGLGRAMDLILTGRRIDAATALDWGLVNRVVPKGEALAAAKALGRDIAALPQESIRTDKESVHASFGTPLDDALREETRLFHRLVRDGTLASHVRGFTEKTHPDFAKR